MSYVFRCPLRDSNSRKLHLLGAAIECTADRYAGSHKHPRQPVMQKRVSLISHTISISLCALARYFLHVALACGYLDKQTLHRVCQGFLGTFHGITIFLDKIRGVWSISVWLSTPLDGDLTRSPVLPYHATAMRFEIVGGTRGRKSLPY